MLHPVLRIASAFAQWLLHAAASWVPRPASRSRMFLLFLVVAFATYSPWPLLSAVLAANILFIKARHTAWCRDFRDHPRRLLHDDPRAPTQRGIALAKTRSGLLEDLIWRHSSIAPEDLRAQHTSRSDRAGGMQEEKQAELQSEEASEEVKFFSSDLTVAAADDTFSLASEHDLIDAELQEDEERAEASPHSLDHGVSVCLSAVMSSSKSIQRPIAASGAVYAKPRLRLSAKHRQKMRDRSSKVPVRRTSSEFSRDAIHAASWRATVADWYRPHDDPLREIASAKDAKKRDISKRESEPQSKTVELEMDFIFLPFPDFLWATYCVGINSVIYWVSRLPVFRLRQFLVRLKILRRPSFDPAALAAKVLLESSMAVFFACFRDNALDHSSELTPRSKESKDARIAVFTIPNFPVLLQHGKATMYDQLTLDIDVTSRRMIRARLDDRELSPSEAVTLIWFYWTFVNHVRLHATANWGINVAAPDELVRQYSIVTSMYNYFGFTAFPKMAAAFKRVGLINAKSDDLAQLLTAAVKSGIDFHGSVRSIMPYSEFVTFVVKLRTHFMHMFSLTKQQYFPCMEGEAFFVGTVIHSLDHTLNERHLEDPLWLDTSHPEFGGMAELCALARVGFTTDLPGLTFSRHFHDSEHPFFQLIFAHAKRLNKDFAMHLDTCIVK